MDGKRWNSNRHTTDASGLSSGSGANVRENPFSHGEQFTAFASWIDTHLVELEGQYADYTTETALRLSTQAASSTRCH